MTEMSIYENNICFDLNQNLTGGNMVKLFKGLVLAAVIVSFTVFGSIAKAADPIRIPVLNWTDPLDLCKAFLHLSVQASLLCSVSTLVVFRGVTETHPVDLAEPRPLRLDLQPAPQDCAERAHSAVLRRRARSLVNQCLKGDRHRSLQPDSLEKLEHPRTVPLGASACPADRVDPLPQRL